MKIYQDLVEVMRSIGVVGKNSTNDFHKYKYRSADDMINAINPVMARVGIIVIPYEMSLVREERKNKKGEDMIFTLVTMSYKFCSTDGSSETATVSGEGSDSGDKSLNKAMTSAYKNALNQVFMIATDMIDSETESPEIASKPSPAPAPVKKPEPKPAPVQEDKPAPSGDYQAMIDSFTSKKDLIAWWSKENKTNPDAKEWMELVRARAAELQ
jgi:hypothetical protein